MTPSDRGPVIQQRLQHLRDSVLSNLWVVHRHYCGQLCQCPQLSDWQASIIADAAAEIQRLTGELAQARRELREQDLEADRLTRELIQAQVELAQAREERDAAQAWAREQSMEEREVRTELTALQASQQGLREALEYLIVKWREYRTTSIAAESKISRLATAQKWSRRAEASTLNVCINDLEAVLTASPVGTAQDPT
jgi:chromosome segregation ATPase